MVGLPDQLREEGEMNKCTPSVESTQALFYVSREGDDRWSGRLPVMNADKTDGPFATLSKARDVLRDMKQAGRLHGAVTVMLRGGRYPISAPIVFGPEDSWLITYTSYPGERAILDGGMRIEGWRVEMRGGILTWRVHLPEVAAGRCYFKQLFVNGQRRTRPRLPKRGWFRMEEVPGTILEVGKLDFWAGADAFRCRPGDVRLGENLTDTEVVALHFWIDERMPIVSFDPETRLVTCSRRSMLILRGETETEFARYYLENVKEALSEPGEWYLDRTTGELWYIPMPGEDPRTAEVYAPRIEQLIKLVGQPDEGRYVEQLRFVGLGFEHTEWRQPKGGGERWLRPPADYANSPQAACHIPGAISFHGARYCAIEDCALAHLGWYGIELTHGCQGNRLVGNTLTDLGAGGIKLESAGVPQVVCVRPLWTCNNCITDNHIWAGGRVFHNAVGILCLDAFGNHIAHNHIHDLFYSGISCGWVWGYENHLARDNRIEKNHIHDLGHGLISDMGGIYILGVQPGTVVRGNLIHHIESADYGGWGIYLDEGSSHVVVENNIVHSVSSESFHQHYGRENILRNNIFALGRKGQVSLTRGEEHNSITVVRNVLISDGQPMISGKQIVTSDLNLFHDVSAQPHFLWNSVSTTLEQMQKFGNDLHSLVADPHCHDISGLDFTLEADSPALALGFRLIDMSDVGPRPKREHNPAIQSVLPTKQDEG
ncbi:MAG: right-handed parallel beta-helix repeat-containing protein [Pedosphaera sp.]|nr:right-handed parallel beta-helix repeat-containing protein [Pedosphaera sp.]